MGQKLFWNFLKNCIIIMIVTDMWTFLHAWVIALEYQFLCKKKKKEKYHILFNKFQFIYQIAIKN